MIAEVTDGLVGTLDGRYRTLVEAIVDYAIYMLDPDGRVISWNTGASRFKGYTEREILGEHFSRFYTDEDRASGLPKRALATAAREGRFEAEGWRVRKDGERFWAHVIIDAIRDKDGELVGYAKITRDLTERRAAEQALRRSEEQFRLLVQGVTDYAIYMLTPNGEVSSWNPGARRIKGYEPQEIIGQHFSRFYTDEDRVAGLPVKALAIASTEGRFENEGWRIRKDGSRFWASVIIDAIRDDSGELLGFAKVTRDVTEKREAEEALQLAQRELFQAQKMEAVGQLTGGIAHDFNNLLMAVLGSLEIAKKRAAAGQENEELIDIAIQGAKRGAALTQRLLAFSRKQDLNLEAVDVPELVREMAVLLERTIGPQIEIATTYPLSLPAVLSDPNQLEAAVLNLVVNARDAMPKGGVIKIEASRRLVERDQVRDLEPGEYVCLSVADEGSGMDAATLEKAITPFFTTKGIGKGTGLGLPMVHGLMAQSGGALVLHSQEGEGTRAELWLPIAKAVEVQAVPVQQVDPVEPTRLDRSLNILAVDDDGLVLMNTSLMLEDLGHTVVEAQSGVDAIAMLLEGFVPDVILTDQAMPHMTGIEFASRAAEICPGTPIVLATGYAELPAGVGENLLKLAKPYSQTQLKDALAAVTATLQR